MNVEKNQEDLAQAASEVLIRELNECEAREIFGGDGATGWVKVGAQQQRQQA